MTYILRDYQQRGVNAALASIGKRQSALIVMPTGSGKSVAIAALIEKLRPSKDRRILVVTHVREIIAQVHEAISKHLPEVSLGVVCAGMDKKEFGRDVTVSSIQSQWWRDHRYHLAIVDEAHLIGRRDNSMYRTLFAKLSQSAKEHHRAFSVVGFTATPYRLDSGYLHQGEDALFDYIGYEAPLMPMVRDGTLAPLTTAPVHGIDFSRLAVRAREYVVKDYTESKGNAWFAETAACIIQAVGLAKDRKHWVVFACTVRHAEAIGEMLAKSGILSSVIHAKTKKQDRSQAIKDFKRGKLRVLINVNVLTTGFDAPNIDCIVLLRPTMSTGLYVQMVGRGMRKATSKDDCLVLDFAGNIDRHGALTDVNPAVMQIQRSEEPSSRIKCCPMCNAVLRPFAVQCAACGHLFPVIEARPSEGNPILPPEALLGRTQKPLPMDALYLSSAEVAGIIGTTPEYIKQMRHFGTGPKFHTGGGPTQVGWRSIVYRPEDVDKWQNSLRAVHDGVNGRRWRIQKDPSKSTRLTEEQVYAIRADKRTEGKIAKEYKISQSLVGNIKRRTRWASLPERRA